MRWSLAITIALLLGVAADALGQRSIQVVAHRGAHAIAGENTLAAIRRAIELDCDYVEIDVRQTRDAALILMHDASVDRTTDGRGAVADLTLEEVRRLRIGDIPGREYSQVPTLAESLALCHGKIGVLLDHKAAVPALVVATIRAHHMLHEVVIYSSEKELAEFKRIEPKLRVQPPHPDDEPSFHRVINELRAETIDGHIREWTPGHVEICRQANVAVWVDVLGNADNEQGYRRAVELEVDVIQTDRPVEAMRFLSRVDEQSRAGQR